MAIPASKSSSNPNLQQQATDSNVVENSIIATGVTVGIGSNEESCLFPNRTMNELSLSPEQAFIHMVKAMLGTGLLSLPLAFKLAGLWLGLVLLFIISGICLICMRQVVFASHFICQRYGRETVDYANIMRGAVEAGPIWIKNHGYFFKQLVNVNLFFAQLGFCCVYFVFMADNLQDFFNQNTSIYLSKAIWMFLLLVPILTICSIRRLSDLAPYSLAANIVYICAITIVFYYFFTNLKPSSSFPAIGRLSDLPLFFGTVMFAFEGVSVIMPIENRMSEPELFIKWNGVLNLSCFVVLIIFAITGFFGYMAVGESVADTVTLNLPEAPFYQIIKVLFALCVMVSYPVQFYVPVERVEKWITRKIPVQRQTAVIYLARYGLVLITWAFAELIPHLALFISLIGAFSGSIMALIIPPFIHALVNFFYFTIMSIH
ncbi:unnamed protein product [Dracunculus medinensis]|uniref:Aa_trans domain-containing protein n=1 Tax=Dracunculus medinensis TaxID=318479 RepID=A0A0N4UK85_DRAME|nr:unnamed protein product [Dracunculus medinensis]